MTRSLLLLAAGVVVFGIGVQQFLTLHHGSPEHTTASRHTKSLRQPNPRGAGHRSGAGGTEVAATVKGLNYVFLPDQVTVTAGSTVTWVNETAAPHTVSSVTRGLFGLRLPGYQRTRLTFRAPGAYRYYCAFHPYMLGTVIVRPGSGGR